MGHIKTKGRDGKTRCLTKLLSGNFQESLKTRFAKTLYWIGFYLSFHNGNPLRGKVWLRKWLKRYEKRQLISIFAGGLGWK